MISNVEYYVVDTHALYWYIGRDKKLGAKARQVIDDAYEGLDKVLVVSVIVLAELYFLLKKHPLERTFSDIYEEVQKNPTIQIVDVIALDIVAFDELEAIPEMHDRLIVALAMRLNVPLITRDPLIIDADVVETIW